MTCLSCTNLLTTSPNFDKKEKCLTCGFSPSSIVSLGYEPNHTLSFWSFILCPIKSPFFQKLLIPSLHDFRFSPPPNSKSRLRLCIKPCAICIPDTGRCILVLLAHLHERLLTALQRCKATKYTLHCFQSKISLVWNGIWKKILVWNGKFLVWNGRKLPVCNMEKSSSIPYHAQLINLKLLSKFHAPRRIRSRVTRKSLKFRTC